MGLGMARRMASVWRVRAASSKIVWVLLKSVTIARLASMLGTQALLSVSIVHTIWFQTVEAANVSAWLVSMQTLRNGILMDITTCVSSARLELTRAQ